MKKVFTAPSLIPCDILRTLLEDAGILCVLKNEGGSAMTGNSVPVPYGSELPWAWPEVWVNDEDFAVASEIAADFQRTHAETQKHERAETFDDPNAGGPPCR